MADYENGLILGLVRTGEDKEAAIKADLALEGGEVFSVGYKIRASNGELLSAEPVRAERKRSPPTH